MRRVLEFLRWKAAKWLEMGSGSRLEDPSLVEGLVAYRSRQADTLGKLEVKFRALWTDPLAAVDYDRTYNGVGDASGVDNEDEDSEEEEEHLAQEELVFREESSRSF